MLYTNQNKNAVIGATHSIKYRNATTTRRSKNRYKEKRAPHTEMHVGESTNTKRESLLQQSCSVAVDHLVPCSGEHIFIVSKVAGEWRNVFRSTIAS